MPKISELPSLASPAGTAFIPAVSSGVTYRSTLASLPISDLTATALATKALLAGSASQDFSAATLSATTVTASGTITGATVTSTGAVNGSSAAITNGVTAASVTATGTVSGATVTSSGAVNGASASITGTATIGTMNATNSTITTGTVTTLTSTTANITTLNGGQQAGYRNKIQNGKMEIAQRGTSHPAANGITLDRFGYVSSGASVVTVSQQGEAPGSTDFQFSIRATVTTADTSIAAGDFGILYQIIEGYNIRDLVNNTFTLSFWVRSTKTGIHCVSLRNNLSGTPDRSYIAEYTINTTNTWEYKTITVSNGLPSAGTWNYTNAQGLGVSWALAGGSTYQTTSGAWQTGNFMTTANQVNCLDSTSNIFAITGVQLERGTVATPFEHRPIGEELALCQRYLPAFVGLGGIGNEDVCWGGTISTSAATLGFVFPVEPRIPPTGITVSNAASFGLTTMSVDVTTCSTITFNSASKRVGRVGATVAGTPYAASNQPTILYTTTAGARILFTGAEL